MDSPVSDELSNSATMVNHHVLLCADPVDFKGGDKVFFDETNKEVILLDSNGICRIQLTNERGRKCIYTLNNFPLTNSIRLVKFAPDLKHVGIQSQDSCVDFVSLTDGKKFTQYCKNGQKKNPSQILGFHWPYPDNLVLVTDRSIELYSFPKGNRSSLKLMKILNFPVPWYKYSHRTLVFPVAGANQLMAFHFRPSAILRIPKFDVDSNVGPGHLAIVSLYSNLYCIVINAQQRQGSLLLLTQDGALKRATIATATPSVVCSVSDNVLLVHNLEAGVTLLYDVKSQSTSLPSPEVVEELQPIAPPLPLFSGFRGQDDAVYHPQWEIHQPNILFETRLHKAYTIDLNLEGIAHTLSDQYQLVRFLLRRTGGRTLALSVIRNLLEIRAPLPILARVFDYINEILEASLIAKEQERSELSEPEEMVIDTKEKEARFGPDMDLILEQNDIYTHVFVPFEESKNFDSKYLVFALVEYTRSLNFHQINPQQFIYKTLVNTLIRSNRFYQLHQFLQYHVVADSENMACQLLSLEATYPPAAQLALDMLKRMDTFDQIVEVLLTRGQLLPALRLLRNNRELRSDPGRFLEAAHGLEDKSLFFTVYNFYQQRGDIKDYPMWTAKYSALFPAGRVA